ARAARTVPRRLLHADRRTAPASAGVYEQARCDSLRANGQWRRSHDRSPARRARSNRVPSLTQNRAPERAPFFVRSPTNVRSLAQMITDKRTRVRVSINRLFFTPRRRDLGQPM